VGAAVVALAGCLVPGPRSTIERPSDPVVPTDTDPSTWTGPDPNPTLDANDEIRITAPGASGEHIFSENREDIRTYRRVHGIPGVMDVFDDSLAASGMTYSHDRNPAGVTIDGVPETLADGGTPRWEMVDGPQGSVIVTPDLTTSDTP
jgi:hypothetical protein